MNAKLSSVKKTNALRFLETVIGAWCKSRQILFPGRKEALDALKCIVTTILFMHPLSNVFFPCCLTDFYYFLLLFFFPCAMKLLCAVVFSLSLLASLASALDFTATRDTDTDTSGDCGNDLKWYYDSSTNKLTINGTGDMDEYSSSLPPWESWLQSMSTIYIENGVTSVGNNAFENSASLTTVLMPGSVTSIGSRAFASCTNLAILSFQGVFNPAFLNAFRACDSLNFICVSKDYSSPSFGGRSISCKSSSCEAIVRQQNHCYEVDGDGERCYVQERLNVSSLSSEINECFQEYCDNNTGIRIRGRCSSPQMLCMYDKCMAESELKSGGSVVVLKMIEGNVTEISPEDIAVELSNFTGVEIKKKDVGMEVDGSGVVLSIFVSAGNYDKAKNIKDASVKCISSQGENSSSSRSPVCSGILENVKYVKILEVSPPLPSSSAEESDDGDSFWLIFGLVLAGVVLIAAMIVIIIVVYKRQNDPNKKQKRDKVIMTDQSVYIVEDSTVMQQLFPNGSTQQTTKASSLTILQAF